MKRWILIGVLVMNVISAVQAQLSAYSQAQTLAELSDALGLPNDISRGLATIAPDGTRIAWFSSDFELCVVMLADGTELCSDLSASVGSVPSYLLWSPDSRYLAFTQEWLRQGREPDLWMLDVETETLSNLTDDGIDDMRTSSENSQATGSMWLEMVYNWGPDGNLYFVRREFADVRDMQTGTTGLYRIAPTGGAPTLLHDLSDLSNLDIYDWLERSLDGALAISPDASQVAFVLRKLDRSDPSNGLWLLSLSEDVEPPRQLLTIDAMFVGQPTDARSPSGLSPSGIAWESDGSGLYIHMVDGVTWVALLQHYRIVDGTLTPMIDFSTMTYQEAEIIDPDTGLSPRYFVPRSAALAPDGRSVLVAHQDRSDAPSFDLWSYRLGSERVEREQLFTGQNIEPERATMASASRMGDVLLAGVLFTP